jgi:predicted 3-demethylubiquinone-9 3-methyltransferase (glyoxalase superfamily)
MITSPDGLKSQRAMRAMMKMGKLDIATLKSAYGGAA